MKRSAVAGALAALVTLTAAPAFASATDDVRAAMLRLAGLSSYEMTFGAGARSGTFDFVKPGDVHMRMSGMEMIHVNNASYMKIGGAGWTKLPASRQAAQYSMADRIRAMTKRTADFTATDLGMKSVDGETLHAYRVKSQGSSESTLYIARDGYVHRIDGGGTDGIIHLSKFNAVAPIRAPI